VARRGKEFADVLEKFVCIRVVQANSIDLTTFQFDPMLTWAVFFLNADRTVYGRYGTRSGANRTGDVTDAGFRKAALAALELHRGYPANRESLRGKIGPAPRYKTPREYPSLAHFPAEVEVRASERNHPSCMHCHDLQIAEFGLLRAAKEPIPTETLWPFPMPDALGLSLDPEERCTVRRVASGSAAEQAGFKAGDELLALEGQPLVSVADVQWVLHGAKDGATLAAKARRGSTEESRSLALPPGWRRSGDITWRQGTWVMFRPDLRADSLPADERKRLGLAVDAVALRIHGLGATLEAAGFRTGDVVVAVAGRRSGIDSVSQLLELVAQTTRPGDKLAVTILRDGRERPLEIALP
jgi:hypothetical protein